MISDTSDVITLRVNTIEVNYLNPEEDLPSLK